MAVSLTDRIAQARTRLNEALLAGEPTADHRVALGVLETALVDEQADRERAEQAERESRRQEDIARAHLLADQLWIEAHGGIHNALKIPARPPELDLETINE